MLFNKLTCPLVFAVLLVAGLAFVATPHTRQRLRQKMLKIREIC